MITLQPLKSKDVFIENPQLTQIWPEISSRIMQEATLEALENNEAGLYLIKDNNETIGITGFYELEEPVLGLRWHGICPSKRHKSISPFVLKEVAKLAKKHYPECTYIAEYVPLTNYSQYIIDHFTQLGFEKFGPIESHDWTPHKTQGYINTIDNLINLNVPGFSQQKPSLATYLTKTKSKDIKDLNLNDFDLSEKHTLYGMNTLSYLFFSDEKLYKKLPSKYLSQLIELTDLKQLDNQGNNALFHILSKYDSKNLNQKQIKHILQNSDLSIINENNMHLLSIILIKKNIVLEEKMLIDIINNTPFNSPKINKQSMPNFTFTQSIAIINTPVNDENIKNPIYNPAIIKKIINKSLFTDSFSNNVTYLNICNADTISNMFLNIEDKKLFLDKINQDNIKAANILNNSTVLNYITSNYEKTLINQNINNNTNNKNFKL